MGHSVEASSGRQVIVAICFGSTVVSRCSIGITSSTSRAIVGSSLVNEHNGSSFLGGLIVLSHS
jgi:hypothetical protein